MVKTASTHEASASATGYLFQCRYALLAGLQAIAKSPQLEISIEKFDNIGFEADGEPTQLIQTKHHVGKLGSLTVQASTSGRRCSFGRSGWPTTLTRRSGSSLSC